jgi:hypothetical protein
MFVKKPSVALKSILRFSMGTKASTTLPTDLSILRDETTGLIIATPAEIIKKIEQLERVALSTDATPPYPPGV